MSRGDLILSARAAWGKDGERGASGWQWWSESSPRPANAVVSGSQPRHARAARRARDRDAPSKCTPRSSARARRKPSGPRCGSASAAHYLERAARLLAARADEFVARIVAETGKPRAGAARRPRSLLRCDSLQFYAKRARHILADRTIPLHLLKTKKLRISYKPAGRGRHHHALELPVHPRAESRPRRR